MSDAPPPLPPLPANEPRTLTLEEKRERQRAYVKKSYYRQQNKVHALKQQVRQLELEFRRIERVVVGSETPATNPKRQTQRKDDDEELLAVKAEEGETDEDDCDAAALTTAYTQLTLLKEELRRENRVLTGVVKEHEQFQCQLGKWVDKTSCAQSTETASCARMARPPPPVVIKPFTVDECQGIAAKCYGQHFEFQATNRFESSGANVFGWRDERRVLDGDRFNFSIKKFFFGRSAAELSLDGWRLNSTPRFRDLFPKSIDMEVHVLQQVDADNVILFRVIHSLDGQFADKTLFLTSRFRIETGYVILFQSLEHAGRIAEQVQEEPESENSPAAADTEATEQQEQERWRGLLTWVVFEEAGEHAEHCLFNFGGVVPSNSAVWMLEILLIALRWENLVVGPVFSIC